MDRRTFLAAGGALALTACATPPRGVYDVTAVSAPQWRPGDSWTFRRTDGYNKLPRGVLTRTVEGITPQGIRFITRDEVGRPLYEGLFEPAGVELAGTLSEDGPVRGTFTPPLVIYDFPLTAGKQWQQTIVRVDGNGFRTRMTTSMRVEGWEDIRTADKSYRALIIHRRFNLGPKDSFTGPMYRDELEWYAPELRGPVHMLTDEWFLERRDWFLGAIMPGDRFVYELQSFRLG